MELLIIAFWVVLGAWCSNIARDRGRSPVWGAIWGILFGFIAIIIYFIMGETQEVKDQKLNALLDAREGTLVKGKKKK